MHAHDSHVTVYAGAGLSTPDPTCLPSAKELALSIVDELSPQIGLDGVEATDLLAVADRVAEEPGGNALLHQTILRVANFRGARTNYAHDVLALLLCEGAIRVLVTNYDDCIERAAQPERPIVVLSAAGLVGTTGARLLKIHGCATLPDTLRVTRSDLSTVPEWVRSQVHAQLHSDIFVFLGIGSPAEYVNDGLEGLVSELTAANVHLVDPSLAETWAVDPPTGWRALLPALAPEQRHTQTGEQFCDALLRAYLHFPRHTARDFLSRKQPDDPHRQGLEALLAAMEQLTAVDVLRWFRGAAFRIAVGSSVVSSPTTMQGLLGLAALVGRDQPLQMLSDGCICLRPQPDGSEHDMHSDSSPREFLVMLVTVHATASGSSLETDVLARVRRARTSGRVPSGQPAIVVLAGHSGRLASELPVSPGQSLAQIVERFSVEPSLDNIVAQSLPNHLIDGPNSGAILLVDANDLFEAS